MFWDTSTKLELSNDVVWVVQGIESVDWLKLILSSHSIELKTRGWISKKYKVIEKKGMKDKKEVCRSVCDPASGQQLSLLLQRSTLTQKLL